MADSLLIESESPAERKRPKINKTTAQRDRNRIARSFRTGVDWNNEKAQRAADRANGTGIINSLSHLYRHGTVTKAERVELLDNIEKEYGLTRGGLEKAFDAGVSANVSPERLKAAAIVLPYIRPQLQSIEATIIDERDHGDPKEVLAQIVALVSRNPALLQAIQAKMNDIPASYSVVNETNERQE